MLGLLTKRNAMTVSSFLYSYAAEPGNFEQYMDLQIVFTIALMLKFLFEKVRRCFDDEPKARPTSAKARGGLF